MQDFALLGTNLIEITADDGSISPYFPLSQEKMCETISQICKEMGLNISIW